MDVSLEADPIITGSFTPQPSSGSPAPPISNSSVPPLKSLEEQRTVTPKPFDVQLIIPDDDVVVDERHRRQVSHHSRLDDVLPEIDFPDWQHVRQEEEPEHEFAPTLLSSELDSPSRIPGQQRMEKKPHTTAAGTTAQSAHSSVSTVHHESQAELRGTMIGPIFGPRKYANSLPPVATTTHVSHKELERMWWGMKYRDPCVEREFVVFYNANRSVPIVSGAIGAIFILLGMAMFSTVSLPRVTWILYSVAVGMISLSTVALIVLSHCQSVVNNGAVCKIMRVANNNTNNDDVDAAAAAAVNLNHDATTSSNNADSKQRGEVDQVYFLESDPCSRTSLRDNADIHEKIMSVILVAIFIYCIANYSGKICHYPGWTSVDSYRTCGGPIQSDGTALFAIIGAAYLFSVRIGLFAVIYALLCFVYFVTKIGPNAPTFVAAGYWSAVVVMAVETAVCIVSRYFRERHSRDEFEVYVQHHVGSLEAAEIRRKTEWMVAAHVPLQAARHNLFRHSVSTDADSNANDSHSLASSSNGIVRGAFTWSPYSTICILTISNFHRWAFVRSPADAVGVLQKLFGLWDGIRESSATPPAKYHSYGDMYTVMRSDSSSMVHEAASATRELFRFALVCLAHGNAHLKLDMMKNPVYHEAEEMTSHSKRQSKRSVPQSLMLSATLDSGFAGGLLHRVTKTLAVFGPAATSRTGRVCEQLLARSRSATQRRIDHAEGIVSINPLCAALLCMNNTPSSSFSSPATATAAAGGEHVVDSKSLLRVLPGLSPNTLFQLTTTTDSFDIEDSDVTKVFSADLPLDVSIENADLSSPDNGCDVQDTTPCVSNPLSFFGIRSGGLSEEVGSETIRSATLLASESINSRHFLCCVVDPSRDKGDGQQAAAKARQSVFGGISNRPITDSIDISTSSTSSAQAALKRGSASAFLHQPTTSNASVGGDPNIRDASRMSLSSANTEAATAGGAGAFSHRQSSVSIQEDQNSQFRAVSNNNTDTAVNIAEALVVTKNGASVVSCDQTASPLLQQRIDVDVSPLQLPKMVPAESPHGDDALASAAVGDILQDDHVVGSMQSPLPNGTLHPSETADRRVTLRQTMWKVVFEFADQATEQAFQNTFGENYTTQELYWSLISSFVSLLALTAVCVIDRRWSFHSAREPVPWATGGLAAAGLGLFLVTKGDAEGAHLHRLIHMAVSNAVEAFYLITVGMATVIDDESIVGDSPVVWMFVLLNWSFNRPLWSPPMVMWIRDLGVTAFFAARAIMYPRTPHPVSNLIIYFLVAYPIFVLTTRLLGDHARRHEFAMKYKLRYLKEELEQDYEHLKAAVDVMVPEGVAGQLLRRIRRQNKWKKHLTTRQRTHALTSNTFATATEETPFLIIQLMPTTPPAPLTTQQQQHLVQTYWMNAAKHSTDAVESVSKICTSSAYMGRMECVKATFDTLVICAFHYPSAPDSSVNGQQHHQDGNTFDEQKASDCITFAIRAVRKLLAEFSQFKHRVLIHSGSLLGAVLGGRCVTFEYFGPAMFFAHDAIEAVEWGSIAATERVVSLHSLNHKQVQAMMASRLSRPFLPLKVAGYPSTKICFVSHEKTGAVVQEQ